MTTSSCLTRVLPMPSPLIRFLSNSAIPEEINAENCTTDPAPNAPGNETARTSKQVCPVRIGRMPSAADLLVPCVPPFARARAEGSGPAILSLVQEAVTHCHARPDKGASQELENERKEGSANERTRKYEALANQVLVRRRRLWIYYNRGG